MRLIDADALREVLETTVPITPITQQYNKEDVIRAIMDAPTIAHGTDSIMIKWTPDLDKLARDVAFRGLNEFSYLGKSIAEWVNIILEQPGWIGADKRPQKPGKYLVYGVTMFIPDHNREPNGYWEIKTANWSDKWGWDCKVKCWQPLPEPPKEENDETD